MKPVGITIQTTFDIGTPDENTMVFYTEGEMNKEINSFIYSYDESAIFESDEKIDGQLEIGDDFVVRSMQSSQSYVMNFREGLVERMIYETPHGPVVTELDTKAVDVAIHEGLGTAKVLYTITLADQEPMLTQVNIEIKDRAEEGEKHA